MTIRTARFCVSRTAPLAAALAWLVVLGPAGGQEPEDEFELPPIGELGIGKPPEQKPEPPETTEPHGEPPQLPEPGEPEISGSLFPSGTAEDLRFNDPFPLASDPLAQLFVNPGAPDFPLPDSPGFEFPAIIRMTGPSTRLTGFRFNGNTAFSDEVLTSLLSEYTGRVVTSEDLEAARQALTRHYIDAGYVTSGARLPDQTLDDEELLFELVEGRLTRVEIEGNNRLKDRYLRHRLEKSAGEPLDMNAIRERLRVLQQDPSISKINAELKPDINPGEAWLDLIIEEQSAFRAGLDFNNYRPPSVGSEQIIAWLVHENLTGFSDTLSLYSGLLSRGIDDPDFGGIRNLGAAYRRPITPMDTEIFIEYSQDDHTVIEEPFFDIDLTGESRLLRGGIRHPFIQKIENELAASVFLDLRDSQTYLFGEPFSLTPGAVDGEIKLSVLRFAQEWTNRSLSHILALRSTFSLGVQIRDETDDGFDRDAEFFSWLGQGQYIRRLGGDDSDLQLVLRSTLQLANDPLLAPEQMSIGGALSTRGYRENQLVRDMGYTASAELRVPLYRSGEKEKELIWLAAAPFVDVGGGWNKVEDERFADFENIVSAGVGLLFQPTEKIDARIYWGHRFTEFPSADKNLQDYGIHFQVGIRGW